MARLFLQGTSKLIPNCVKGTIEIRVVEVAPISPKSTLKYDYITSVCMLYSNDRFKITGWWFGLETLHTLYHVLIFSTRPFTPVGSICR